MMNNGGNFLENPFVRAVPYPVHVLICRACQVRLPFGNDSTRTGSFNCIQNDSNRLFRIIQNNASKSNVDGWWTSTQEFGEVLWWRELRGITKEEAAYICTIILL